MKKARLLSLLLVGCIPRVARFERFDLQPGHADVLWLFIDERLHRCINLPKGPVCARVSYIKGEAEAEQLPSIPPTPPAEPSACHPRAAAGRALADRCHAPRSGSDPSPCGMHPLRPH